MRAYRRFLFLLYRNWNVLIVILEAGLIILIPGCPIHPLPLPRCDKRPGCCAKWMIKLLLLKGWIAVVKFKLQILKLDTACSVRFSNPQASYVISEQAGSAYVVLYLLFQLISDVAWSLRFYSLDLIYIDTFSSHHLLPYTSPTW